MGIDKGIRKGVKVEVVDGKGKMIEKKKVYNLKKKKDVRGKKEEMERIVRKKKIEMIEIGKGKGRREKERIVVDMI